MKIQYIFAFFAVLGAIDKIFGNRFKLGEEFEKAIMTTGTLILAICGTMVLAPVLAQGMKVIFTPVANTLGIDLSVMASFLANDAGGAAMAYELSADPLLRAYNGLIVSSMLGATICPVIPLVLSMTKKEHHNDILTGLLWGIATIPVGCLVAGLSMGIPFGSLLLNSLPLIILSAVICFGLARFPEMTRKIFAIFGAALGILITVGLAIGIVHQLTGLELIPGIAPLHETFSVVGEIAVVLAGAFPMLMIISRLLKKPLAKFGRLLGINESAALGFLPTMINVLPTFSMLDKMDSRGRILNMAFAVSATCVFGDHLAFTMAFDNQYVTPMIIGKLISGLAGLTLAWLFCRRETKVSA